MRILLTSALCLAVGGLQAAAFAPGNLVVYRVGDGASGLVSSGAQVFLDEFTASGTLVQSIALPSTGSTALVASGTASSEGLLSNSADGRYLLLTGYRRDVGISGPLSGTIAETVNRVVARVNAQGVIDANTAFSDFADGNNPRSAASVDGSTIWFTGGAGAVRTSTFAASTSLAITPGTPDPQNFRQLGIFAGQLYFSTSSGSTFRIGSIGSGTPSTAGQTLTALPGFPVTGQPNSFFFADLSSAVSGVDTLYVADDGAGALGKYSLVSGAWTSNGSIGIDTDDYRGLTARVSGAQVTLFATRRGGTAAAGGGELVSLVDASGYNAALTGIPTLLASAGANRAFRGVALVPTDPLGPVMRITEFSYSSAGGEFVEFTNVGDRPADLSGFSFDDDSNVAGTQDLSAFALVQPGESVILTESAASAFRTSWNLCAGVKVIGGLTANLGGTDRINLFDASNALVDRLDYSNTGNPTIVLPNVSAYTSASALGQNQISAWARSTVGDVEQSTASTLNDIGSPGKSQRALFAYDPCVGTPGTPLITVNPTTTSPFLDLPINGSGAISGVLSDPSDPATVVGVGFTLSDDADVGLLNVTATSSNLTIVPAAGLQLTGTGASRLLRITPAAVGLTAITLRAADAGGRIGTYVINYAVSAASLNPSTTRFHAGASDASTSLALDAQTMLVADDENQGLRLYRRDQSGMPLASFDFTAALGLTDLSGGIAREVDIEGSTLIGNRVFWVGSHGNQATGSFNARPNRKRIFATDVTGSGANAVLSYVGRYDFLVNDLVLWDQNNGHGLGANALGLAASSAANVSPELATGFNIEALTTDPTGVNGWIAFRAPRQTPTTRDRALVIPVLNLNALVTGGVAGASQPVGSSTFGAPIFLDLGLRAIRSMDRNASGQYLLVAGPSGVATGAAPDDFRLFQWNGNPATAPALTSANLTALASGGSFEGIVSVPETLGTATELQLTVDNGDTIYYANGVIAKDLSEKRHAKFRSERISVDLQALPELIFANSFE